MKLDQQMIVYEDDLRRAKEQAKREIEEVAIAAKRDIAESLFQAREDLRTALYDAGDKFTNMYV